jgi:hypothetical protein
MHKARSSQLAMQTSDANQVVMVIIAILNNPSIHRKVSWQQIYRRLSC